MITILSENQARQLDEQTIQSGLSESKLMKNAGMVISRFFLDEVIDPFSQSVLVVAGKGNNGGDAIIAHHFLLKFGINSQLMVIQESQLHSPLLTEYPLRSEEILIYEKEKILPETDWIIEGIFGIGLKRDITGIYAELINEINQQENVISVDIPSGIQCDTGMSANINIQADKTLTMGYPKIGNLINDGLNAAGELHIMDIGFTELRKEAEKIQLLTIPDGAQYIQPYPRDSHKYSRGKVGVLAGSIGMTGAGILTANSTLKAGAGITRIAVPESLNTVFETNLIEVITIPMADNNSGILTMENKNKIKELSKWCDCLVCGPGLSSEDKTTELTRYLLTETQKSIILDGSGFNPIINGSMKISELSQNTILTPHLSEFSAIFSLDIERVRNDPITALQSVTENLYGRVLILKGSPTFIVTSSESIEICNMGSPVLATAGTGDVLAGLLGGLVAQGYAVDIAARIGVTLHAIAGELYLKSISERGMCAGDLINLIPSAWDVLLNEN